MKSLHLFLFILLGIIGCTPSNNLELNQSLNVAMNDVALLGNANNLASTTILTENEVFIRVTQFEIENRGNRPADIEVKDKLDSIHNLTTAAILQIERLKLELMERYNGQDSLPSLSVVESQMIQNKFSFDDKKVDKLKEILDNYTRQISEISNVTLEEIKLSANSNDSVFKNRPVRTAVALFELFKLHVVIKENESIYALGEQISGY